MRIRLLALTCCAVTAAGAAGFLAAPAASADSALPPSFEILARADGVRAAATMPGAPLSDTAVDVSSNTTEAFVDGLGVSRSMAALPYPGATITNLPDVARGQFGAPVGSYPLIAASNHPAVATAEVVQPGLKLSASSAENRAEGSLATGSTDPAGPTQATSASSASAEANGRLSASAVSSVVGALIGPLHIGRVDSEAGVVRVGDGEPQRKQGLDVSGLSLAGQSFGVGPDGALAGANNTPLPDDSAIRSALTQAGLDIQYLKPIETADGMLSAGLVITQTIPFSSTGEPSTIVYTFGRSFAQIIVGAASAGSASDAVAGGVMSDGAGQTDGQTDGPSVSGAPGGLDTAALPGSLTGIPAPAVGTLAASSEAVVPDVQMVQSMAGSARPDQAWSSGVFGLPAAGAALVFLLFLAVRYWGVRSTWGS